VRLVRRLARIARISDAYQSELHEAKAALERSSRTDPMTGVPNRLDLLERFGAELMRARRHERPLVVIMLDLDDFKQVNDAHGHLAGDQVLVAVGHVLRANLRGEDLYARWGGEEFLIVQPETDLAQGQHTAEKLRRLIEELVVPVGAATLRVTASFGVALCHGSDEPDLAIRRADVALYEAKTAGRNRCVVSRGEVEAPAGTA
jgi:diguanylate cyclase (GGDEF)-like protein